MVLNSNNCQNSISGQDSINWTAAFKKMAFLFEVYITLLVCYLYSVVSDRALVPTVIDLPASLSSGGAFLPFHCQTTRTLFITVLHHMHLVILSFPTFTDKKQTPAMFTHVWHVKRQPSWIPTLLFLSPLVRFDRDLVFAGAHLDVRF